MLKINCHLCFVFTLCIIGLSLSVALQAKRCNPQKPPSHGSLSCSDPNGEFSFGSRCTSTCDEGFLLNGTARAECTSLGAWNADIPRCMGKENVCINWCSLACNFMF